MSRITQTIATRHLRNFLRACKGRLPSDFGQDDKAVETILDQPEKIRRTIVRDLLDGAPPKQYEEKIQDALQRADGKILEYWRRTLVTERLLGDKWSVKSAMVSTTNPLSIRNLTVGTHGLLTYTWEGTKAVSRTVLKDAPKAAWRERGKIALGAALGTLLLPGVGTVIGTGVGAFWNKFKPSQN